MTVHLPYTPSRFRFSSSSILPIVVLIDVVFHGLNFYANATNGQNLKHLTTRSLPSVVQLVDGKVIQVGAAPTEYRSQETLERFTRQWALLTFTWGKVLKEDGKPIENDPGVMLDLVKGKVPTNAANAGFLVAVQDVSNPSSPQQSNLRQAFLTRIAALAATVDGVFTGRQQTVLEVDKIVISPAKQRGMWTVYLLSHLTAYTAQGTQSAPIINNLKLTVLTAPPPDYPMQAGLSPTQQMIYRLGAFGLRITHIENFSAPAAL